MRTAKQIFKEELLGEPLTQESVIEAIKIAQKEMFKFAEWIGIKEYEYYPGDSNHKYGTPSWFDSSNHSLDCSTEELFEKYLKERK